MTLVSDIITDAHRLGNILPIGDTPTDDENTEGLRYLNRIVKSVFGNEVGDPLTAFPIGKGHIINPPGYPWWDGIPSGTWYCPKNVRLVCNLTFPVSVPLHPNPDDGSRFAVTDTSLNLSTYPLTIEGNGRLFEGGFTSVLNTDGLDKEWMFRADLGNWQVCSPLVLTDTFPFPEEFDDYFITLLAIRLYPAYGVSMTPEASTIFKRSGNQIRARYKQSVQVRSELGLIRPPRVAQDRDLWGYSQFFYDPDAMFERGWPW